MVRRRTSGRKKRSTAYTGMARTTSSHPARKSGLWVLLVLGALVVINLYVFVWDKKTSVRAIAEQAHNATPAMTVPSAPLAPPALRPICRTWHHVRQAEPRLDRIGKNPLSCKTLLNLQPGNESAPGTSS